MSTPMFDIPTHLKMGVNAQGQGPVMEDEPDFDHYECWCGDGTCDLYMEKDDGNSH